MLNLNLNDFKGKHIPLALQAAPQRLARTKALWKAEKGSQEENG